MKNYAIKKLTISRGETLAYRSGGKGSEVALLIHGNMSSSVHFQTIMETLEEDYTVYALDLRGFGDSTYNNKSNIMKEYALDVLEFIKILGLKNIHLLGWSAGGGVAMELAALTYDTDIIKDMVLLSSMGVKGLSFNKDTKLSTYGRNWVKKGFNKLSNRNNMRVFNNSIPTKLGKSNINPMSRDFYNKYAMEGVWNMTIYNINMPDKEDYDTYIEASLRQQNLRDIVSGINSFNITADEVSNVPGSEIIKLINIPILIVHGDSDLVVKPTIARESKAAFGSKAQLIIFRNAGHSIMTDNLEGLSNVLKRFWKYNKV